MWKKEEDETPADTPGATPRRERAGPGASAVQHAAIGPSISINGEVTGDEDLLIEGRVDGSVDLKQHSVTVGPEGKVNANISGRVVTVEGTVKGDLDAHEQVILRSSAVVEGDISAPRVVLEDGASFRGGVDMGEGAGPSGRRGGSGGDAARKSAASGDGSSKDTGSGSSGSGKTEEEKSGTDTPIKTAK